METLVIDRSCVECEKIITKAHRRYHEAPYCTSCYYREFKHRECMGCGDNVRLPSFDANALCPACEQKKPCVRCDKKKYNLGKFTKYGPVCNACSIYFRKIEHCEVCGVESQQLSKTKNLSHDLRVCPRCIRSTHATCQRCKRHRELKETTLGEKICNTCFTKGYIECPKCDELMPAGRGNCCEECYWSGLLSKRTEFVVTLLSSKPMRNHAEMFSHWFRERRGSNVAAIRIEKYLPFFLKLDRQWRKIPKYEELLEHFGPEGLRRFRLAVTWMVESRLITLDEKLKKHYSELGQITRHIERIPADTICGEIINNYLNVLYEKKEDRNTSIRSLRLSLSSAIDMILNYHKDLDQPVNQDKLTQYLIEKNGQKSNLTPFISFLNKEYNCTLSTSVDKTKVIAFRRKTLEALIVEMQTEHKRDDKYIKKWVVTNLQFYHHISHLKALTMFKAFKDEPSNDGYSISSEGDNYWIPKPMPVIPSMITPDNDAYY